MIARLIAWSARNLLLVLFGTGFAAAAGIYALVHLPLDAIPDNSSNAHRITRAEVEAALTDWCASHGDAPLCRKLQAQ